MFERLLFQLLKAKLDLFAIAKIPLIATLLVLGTTGFVVTGTIQGDDDEGTVNVTVKPLETKTCVDALIAQTETLFQLDALAADATAQLRHLRERARENADEQNKAIGESALGTQFATSSGKILDALSAARKRVFDAADLTKCQDLDSNTTVTVDGAALRATYDAILRDFGSTLNGILGEAQRAFDALVASAPSRPKKTEKEDSDHEDDDD